MPGQREDDSTRDQRHSEGKPGNRTLEDIGEEEEVQRKDILFKSVC